MAKFYVEQDASGNAEVSAARPQKLKPLDDQAAAPKSAMKSALKGSAPTAGDPVPQPPPGNPPPKSAMKSALKNRVVPPEPEEEQPPASVQNAAPKSALKSSMKRPAEPEEAIPQQVPGKAKSALKSKPAPAPEEAPPGKAKSALKQRASVPAAPGAASDEDKSPSSARKLISRPSTFKMNVDISEDSAWTKRGLAMHYFHYASQQMLWEQQASATGSRKSIKLEDLEANKMVSTKDTSRRFSWMTKKQSLIIEEQPGVVDSGIHHGVISPLKDLFLAKKPDAQKVRDLLKGLPGSDRWKWVNEPLDATPPPMPAPLFFAVSGVHANLVEVLIEYDVDVTSVYKGTGMLKGWVKPETSLIECCRSRKGRFVGTMLGDKLEKIEMMLTAAKEKGEAPVEKKPPPAASRRKSVLMPTCQGTMEHTHDHPSSKYTLVGTHDDGNPSNVRHAENIDSGEHFAIKAGSKVDEASASDPEAALWTEIGIIRKLDHPNIVRLHETFENDTNIYMVLEGCLGGELFDRLVYDGAFTEATSMRFAYQMGSALRHLHQFQICHRDIQPEAFFLAEEELAGSSEPTGIKLIDFSTAKEFSNDRKLTTKVCTLHYVAPEIITSKDGYTEKVDIWSFGVLLFTMLAGAPPFNAESEMDILNLVKAGTYAFTPEQTWSNVTKATQDLVRRCLTVEPAKRPDMWGIMDSQAMVEAEAAGAAYTASEKLGRHTTSTSRDAQAGSHAVKAAFSLMAEVITDDQVAALRRLFEELDTTESGMVELEDCVDGINQIVKDNADAHELVKVLKNGALVGRVNYLMYLATMTDRRRHLRREAARAVFNNFDIDKNGNISLYEIAQALSKSEGISMSKVSTVSFKEVQKIWHEMKLVFKENHGEMPDREMTFDEFFKQLPNSNKDIAF